MKANAHLFKFRLMMMCRKLELFTTRNYYFLSKQATAQAYERK